MADLLPVFDAVLTRKGEERLATLERRTESWEPEDLTEEDLVEQVVLAFVSKYGILPSSLPVKAILEFTNRGYVELTGQLSAEEYLGRIEGETD